ncbi:hypothetical protein SPBR_03267 [Sporothrix brasiliensis 5110]|uniref:Uncharacterized protein n=1 Tax=Sporothrix brasiliensis 5110 TaxID=1398154 RepID=A0A0C2J108_9PEZI|nr:uncharacterized protein SPBR_03267 [Sporothrix brasiliensis 5110]KIH92665.1 hypothetical protein SPBR_03267 [Sporothrix brasiliensis 5110]
MAFLTAASSASDVSGLQTQKTSTHPEVAAQVTGAPAAHPESFSLPINKATATPTPATTAATTTTHVPLSLRSSTLDIIYRCHSNTVYAWALAATAAKPAAWVARHTARLLIILGTFLVATAQLCAVRCGQAIWQAFWWHLWACKPATRLRKKLYFEVALLFMGPSGNGVLLVVLWPGWLVLAAAIWGLSVAVTPAAVAGA